MEETGKVEKKQKNAKKEKSFFKGLQTEFKKIIWPDKESLWKQTTVVLIISIIMCGFIRLIDILVQFGVEFIVK
ncbi:preprotein translocase subunit SecE [Clostridiales bacterium CHKCI001]|nr:preprotein translocase subunit SecE [Clostridiales bacterium CHKCI001]